MSQSNLFQCFFFNKLYLLFTLLSMVANVNLSKRQSIEIIIDVNKKIQILSTGNSFHDILFVNLKSSFHFVFVLCNLTVNKAA